MYNIKTLNRNGKGFLRYLGKKPGKNVLGPGLSFSGACFPYPVHLMVDLQGLQTV